ncbi:hypothetical protein ACFZDF_09180 [Streptomyces sp. NPDC007910]
MTFHPVSAHRDVLSTSRAAIRSSGAQDTGTSAYPGPEPPTSR